MQNWQRRSIAHEKLRRKFDKQLMRDQKMNRSANPISQRLICSTRFELKSIHRDL